MTWLIISEWLARAILLLLVLLSFWSVAIMLDRKRFFRDLLPKSHEGNFPDHPLYESCAKEFSGEGSEAVVERKFENFVSKNRPTLERGIPVLGTLGSTAPFIGLLGTVLGIIKAFGDLSINSQDTNAVMFALAEALILTAVGLAVAIPAVVAYNVFNRKARAVIARFASIKNEILNRQQKAA